MSHTALIFYHKEYEGPSLFGQILEEQGFEQKIIFTPQEDISKLDPLKPGLLMVMGGPMSVYEGENHPYLEQEIEFLKARLAQDLPTMGICLGGQLIAAALGERVYRGKNGREIAWAEISVSADSHHPVCHLDQELTNMFHWHGDTFDLPEGAKLLASSEKYQNQVFEIGKKTIGLQCHPEVTQWQIDKWMDIFAPHIEEDAYWTREKLEEETAARVEILNKQARLFFEGWLKHVELS